MFENLFYHLRPGTYDITIKRSIQSIKKRKIKNLESILSFQNVSKNLLSSSEIRKIDKFLASNKLSFNSAQLYNILYFLNLEKIQNSFLLEH